MVDRDDLGYQRYLELLQKKPIDTVAISIEEQLGGEVSNGASDISRQSIIFALLAATVGADQSIYSCLYEFLSLLSDENESNESKIVFLDEIFQLGLESDLSIVNCQTLRLAVMLSISATEAESELKLLTLWILWKLARTSEQNKVSISEIELISDLILVSFDWYEECALQFNDLLKTMRLKSSDILNLFELLKSTSNQRYLSILSSLLDKQYDSHFTFQNSSLVLKATPTTTINSYTVLLWIKLNSLNHNEMLAINDTISFRLESSRLIVYHRKKEMGVFDIYQFEENIYHHIVLVHSTSASQPGRAKIRLYLNGQYIESLNCPLPFHADVTFHHDPEVNIKIGATSNTDMNISNLLILAGAVSLEWILLSFFLGRGYSGNYQDPDILKCLNYEQRVQFNLRLLESVNNRTGEYNLKNLDIIIPKGNILFNFNNELLHNPQIIMANSSIKNNPSFTKSDIVLLGETLFFEFESFTELFYSVSCLQLVLDMIESSKDMKYLYSLVKFFLKVINKNWKFIEEAESKSYFNILSRLLRFKKIDLNQDFEVEFFDLFLGFVGYDFASPFNSVISNHLVYETIIFDFNLWKANVNEEENTEILEFMLFQISVFGRESRYANFNTLKFKKLKIVKKLLNGLSLGLIPSKLNDALCDCLLTLVKGNMTQEVIQLLSSFTIYALNERNRDSAILVLKVLAEAFLDPLFSNLNLWKRLFSSCSIKWIMLLLDLGRDSKLVLDIGLSFLIKIFTVSHKTYDMFIKSNGLSALLGILKDNKLFDEVEIGLLIKGSFSQYHYNMSFEPQYTTVDKTSLKTMDFHELNFLILDMLEWTVLNDIFKDGGHDKVIGMLNMYANFISDSVQENISFQKVMESDLRFIRKISNMILLLNKPTNASVYFECSQKFIGVLSNIIIIKLFKEDTGSFETYLNTIVSSQDALEGGLETISVIFMSLVFPQVLAHLKGFSSEFAVLLETNGMKFSNVAVLLSYLSNYLLSFEWNSKDYMNFLSILLDIVEAYRGSRKNTRSPYYLQLVRDIPLVSNALVCVLRYSTAQEQEGNYLKVLMFHQENLFNRDILNNDAVSNLIALLLHIGSNGDPLITNMSFNCLRMILMHRQDDMSAICSCVTFRNFLHVMKFLSSIISLSDEDVVSNYLADEKLKDIFGKHLENVSSKAGKKYNKDTFVSAEMKIDELIEKFESSVKTKYELLDALAGSNKHDIETLRLKILSNENMRTARYVQDQEDNLQFYLLEYNKLKAETKRVIGFQLGQKDPTKTWTVDNMEGIDRMRKILLPHTEVNLDQNLTEVANVPARKTKRNSSTTERKGETQSLQSVEFIEADVIDESLNTYNDRNRKVLKCLFHGDKIQELWNVSQVVGLDIVEGILILGETHLYIIHNYFHKAENDEIIDIDEASEHERDPNIKLITGQSSGVKSSSHTKSPVNRHNVQSWDLFKLTSVTKRRFLLRDVALELFFSNGGSFLITSMKIKDRDVIFSKLSSVATNSNIDNDLSNIFKETNLNTGNPGRNFTNKLANVFGGEYLNYLEATKKWQNGEMSNFYYLIIVNTFAGRTFNDLTQYPVFPWVIADYTSDELDLNNPESFRDLTKPMGAQSSFRAQQFKDRYEALESLQDDDAPPFHYGTHYSSAMIVASFLIRLEPFVQSYLLLQGGKFDHPDRLFNSIQKTWKSASTDNTTDVRELIPEFFFLPEFLTNINCYEFGHLQDGTEVSDVGLPPWAKGDPRIFITKNREALESPYVSERLHNWIDLVFGYKQTGPEAVEALNVFNHLSYRGAIDLDSINNEDERRSITGIIHNFGQTPVQIFTKPHPERDINTVLSIDPNFIKKSPTLIYQTKFQEPIEFLHFKTHSDSAGDTFWRGYPALHLNGEIEVKKGPSVGSLIINRQTFERLHDDKITTIVKSDVDTLLTGSESGVIHVWKYLVIVKGLNEQLEFETRLRAHTAPIKELRISPEFNLLLSLDTKGDCYLWDLARFTLIRKIGCQDNETIEHVAIAYDSGMIATSYRDSISIFNVNGSLIFSGSIGDGDESGPNITSLGFANPRTESSMRLDGSKKHEPWRYIALLTSGWSNGAVKLHDLQIKGAGWDLACIKSLKFYDGKKSLDSEGVSIVESYLKSYFNFDDEKVGKVEIVAGDVNGRVAVWRQ